MHEVSRNEFKAKKGDIVVFLRKDDYENPQFSHVGFVREDYSGTGPVLTIEGNTTSKYVVAQQERSLSKDAFMQIVGFVRPNYGGSSSTEGNSNASNQVEYFSCNVQIQCIVGKQVNLYNNPGDTKRVDYFSKGQTVQSTYAAKIGNATWYQIQARSGNSAKTYWLKYESDKMTVTDITPAPKPDQPQYFNCNVQISCISGKQVNLYNNPGDTNRVDYFSKGQTVQSTYAAKIGNTTWYQIKAQSGNTTKTYWLRYESDKMTIKDLTSPPPTESLKVTVNPSNITLDIAKQKSQTVTAAISGDIPNGLKLGATISNPDIVDFQWADSAVREGKARATLTGKATGNSIVTFKLLNTSGQTIASGSVNITVIDTTPVTMTVNPSIVSLDLAKQTSQTVSLTISGNIQGQLVGTVGDSNVAEYSWEKYGGGNVVRVIITGKNAGGTIVRFALRDQNTGEVLASAYVHVAVISSTYTVSYNANGGTNAPSPQTKAHQQAVTISNSQPTREGYTFLGWSISANGPVRYRPGAQYTDNQSITLYAVWQQNPTKASVILYRIELDEETLNVGESTPIHVIAVYSDDSTKDVTASCSLSLSDSSVASINRGRITAIKEGTTDINIISAPDGMHLYAVPTLTVVSNSQAGTNPIVRIEIRPGSSTISIGESTDLEVYAVHEDGTEDIVTSESSISTGGGIIDLDGYAVTGLSEGSEVVFAYWNDYSSSTEIYVNPSYVEPPIDDPYSDWFDSIYSREENSHSVYRDDNT